MLWDSIQPHFYSKRRFNKVEKRDKLVGLAKEVKYDNDSVGSTIRQSFLKRRNVYHS